MITHRIEDRQIHVSLSSLAGRHSTNHLGAILDGLLAVERSLFAGESLANDPSLGGQDEVLAGRIVRGIAAHGRGQTEAIYDSRRKEQQQTSLSTALWTLSPHVHYRAPSAVRFRRG